MSSILTRYSNPKTVSLLGDPAKYYQLVQSGVEVEQPADLYAPLSYNQWLSYNRTVLREQSQQQYNLYLQGWYASYYTTQDDSRQIYADYIALVNSLKTMFGDDPQLTRLAELDLNDQFQLSVAIPHLAHKLKQLAAYYLAKREDVKTAKLRYNLAGSKGGLEKIVYNSLLRAFSKSDSTITLDQTVWSEIPALADINKTFAIQIDELYDAQQYLDRDPDMQPSQYGSDAVDLGVYQLTTTNPLVFSLDQYIRQFGTLLVSNVSEDQFEDNDTSGKLNVYNQALLANSAIGTTQFFVSGGSFQPTVDTFTIEFKQGANTLYWPYGELYVEAVDLADYQPLYLQQTAFIRSGATAGATIDVADVIWVTDGSVVSAAWLKDFSKVRVDATMLAELKRDSTTIFKFPYPGFGSYDSNKTWSGKTLNNFGNNSRDHFALQQAYWNDNASVSSIDPLSIHNTSLIADGAYGSASYNSADKITVRPTAGDDHVHDSNPNGVFNFQQQTAWLYRPMQTQLPIIKGSNAIYWPLFVGTDATSPPLQISKTHCTPIALSALDPSSHFRGAVAGLTPETSDIIELVTCDGTIQRAWLSSCPVSQIFKDVTTQHWLTGAAQPALNVELAGAKWTRFIYDAPDKTASAISNVAAFVGYQHDADCPYLQSAGKISMQHNKLVGDQTACELWKTCKCKAVYYSPFGHRGNAYDDNHRFADVIMLDTQFPAQPAIASWKDERGNTYATSSDFAWFKLEQSPDKDAGWGKGTWVTGSGEPFKLRLGHRYAYMRVAICCDGGGPPLIVNHGHCNRCGEVKPEDCTLCITPFASPSNIGYCSCTIAATSQCCDSVWVGMYLDTDNRWKSTNATSKMKLFAGERYNYIHRDVKHYAWTETALTTAVSTLDVASTNFIITVPLSGWDVTTASYLPSANGAKPYWANTFDDQNGQSIDCYTNNSPREFYDYLRITQPNASKIELTNDLYLEYKRNSSAASFIWTQPLVFTVNANKQQWCHIDIDSGYQSKLLDDMHISNCSQCVIAAITAEDLPSCKCQPAIATLKYDCGMHRLLISATSIPSQIILNGKVLCSDYTTISYCAQNAFTLVQPLTNVTQPTTYVAPVTGQLVTPTAPWRNIINRHFPTVAIKQSYDSLRAANSYGIINPTWTGALQYVGQNYVNYVDIAGQTYEKLVPIIDPAIWSRSRGLTHNDQNTVVHTRFANATWMKSPATNRVNAGAVNAVNHQTFVAYQSLQQTNATNDAFAHPYADVNSDIAVTQSKDFHGYYNLSQWLSAQPEDHDTLVAWKTDVYGNQYMLTKPLTSHLIATNRAVGGTLWIRNNDRVTAATIALSALYNKYSALNQTIFSDLTAGNIQAIDVIYDTLVLSLPSHVLVERIKYDVATSQMTNVADYTSIIDLSGNKFAGTWLDTATKTLLLAQASVSGIPHIWAVDINTGQLRVMDNGSAAIWSDISYTSLGLQLIGSPSITVNSNSNTLVMTSLMRDGSNKLHIMATTWQITSSFAAIELQSIDIKYSV